MKKILLLFCLLVIGFSFSALAKKVEINDARIVGKNFFYEHVNHYYATPYAAVSIKEEIVEKANNEPVYYIFNFSDDRGFVIVAADDAVNPVLGYSFEGSYTTENVPAHIQGWMDKYKNEIVYVKEQNLSPDDAIIASWRHLLTTNTSALTIYRSTTDVAPLIVSNWNQDFPYNALCPEDAASTGSYQGRVPVGCVATTMAQIMYYWRWPDMGVGQHCIFPTPPSYGAQCANFGTSTYDWTGMTNMPNKECYPAALISYQAGVSVDMDYAPAGSGAYVTKVPSALINNFKYNPGCIAVQKMSYSTTDWENLMKADLDQSLPIEYAGSGPDGGHAWVMDGYQGTDYFHFNWGWGGADNGYYYLTNLNPGGVTFNQSQQAVIHIQPNTTMYPQYCAGQTNVTTYAFGTIEDGSGPVKDYQNNAACSWLIAPNDSISSIKLTFVTFATDPADVVKVYDGATTSDPLLGTYSGTALPSMVTGTGGKMLVTFTSNSGTTAPGFMAMYDATLVSFCKNSTTLTGPAGTITDGSNSYQYRNSTTCKWQILPTGATSVILTFNSINTEQDKDVVTVYDLGTGGGTLGTFSGTTIPPAITSPSGKMLVMFNTNASVRGEGFSASYTITVGTEETKAFENLTIYPNPAEDFVNVSFNISDIQNVKLELISMNGTTLRSETMTNFKGNFERKIDVSSLQKGVYLLRLTSDKGIVNRKITVQ